MLNLQYKKNRQKHVQTVFRKDISITQEKKKNSCNASYFEASAFSVLQKT